MKDKKNNPFIKKFYSYLLSILLYTIILPILGIIFAIVVTRMDFQWLFNISPFLYRTFERLFYFVYTEGFTLIIFGMIWLSGVVILLIRLLRKVYSYVCTISDASTELFNQDVEYIELPPEFDEFQKQVNALKREADKNERLRREAEQRKNDLIIYLAHDLKTPLASVIGYLNLIRDEKEISEANRDKYLSICLDKADRLEFLINEFFEIARFNLADVSLQYSKINLTLLLQQLTYEFMPILKEKNLQCNLDSMEDIILKCDANKIQRVFDNLLRNAIIYSFDDTEINISIVQDQNAVYIKFKNHGNTIPKDSLERIFEQFYRLDHARSTSSGGAGLGLAIAKQIVELHNGTITAFSENELIEFTVMLPKSL